MSPADPPIDAAALHRAALVADTHNDLLMLVADRPVDRWASYFRERWLPQLRDGGVDLQVLPVFIDDVYRPDGALRQTLRMLEAAHRLAEGNPDDVAIVTTGRDIRAVVEDGRIALVLALEGCPQIDADVELLTTCARLGVRMVSLAHFSRSALADGSGEDAAGSRLTRAGVAAVAELERLGVLLDVSHLGVAGVEHALEIARRPVIASHSSARALRDHHRNLTDDQLRAIAGNGGVVCVNVFAGFIDPDDRSVERVADHVLHLADVAGPEHVGLGPDFVKEVLDERFPLLDELLMEGVDAKQVIVGLEGPAGLPLITAALVRRGLDEGEIRGILGENVLRLFEAELGVPLR